MTKKRSTADTTTGLNASAELTQEWQVTTTQLLSVTLTAPGRYRVVLSAEGASVHFHLGYAASGKESAAIAVEVIHAASRTTAKVDLKTVVSEQAFVRMLGKLVIMPGAVGCQSFLSERALLLDPLAKAETVPELEISNQDVTCSHAASISSPGEDQILFLQSRGCSAAEAKSLIGAAFLLV